MVSIKSASSIIHLLTTSILIAGLMALPAISLPQEVKASYPGYNGKIVTGVVDTAWTNEGSTDIYTLDSNGTNHAPLVATTLGESRPRWSSDGTEIVFVANWDGNVEIYRMNSDGSNQVRLTNNSVNDDAPHFSPDGVDIVFRSARDGNNEIYLMDRDGGNVRRLTNNVANDTLPTFHPNGNQILFTSDRDGDQELFTMNLDGSNQTQLTFTSYSIGAPKYSPDGLKIVYTANSGAGSQNRLWIINSDGTNPTQLTYDPPFGSAFHSSPSWSPDGTKILFTAPVNPEVSGMGRAYFILPASGGTPDQLTEDIAGTSAISDWQPIPNIAPILATKTLSLQSNSSQVVDVIVGATDEEALDSANLTIYTQPTHGTAVIESGKVKYTSASNYVGMDELTYQICDSFMLDQKCSTAVLGITVKPAASVTQVGEKIVENGVEKVIASSNRPTFSGTATSGSTVKVEIHSDPIILTTTADSSGNWSVTPDQDLPAGDHTVLITATLNGITTELDSFVLAVQQTIPNTGAGFWLARIGGGMVLVIGLGLAYWQRRKMRQLLNYSVPKLFS